jgi:hypothetical protein
MKNTVDEFDVITTYPRRNRLMPIIRLSPEFVRFGYHPIQIPLTVVQQKIFDELNGNRSSQEIIDNLNSVDNPERLIRMGLHTAVLLDRDAIPEADRWIKPLGASRCADADLTHLKISMPEHSNQKLVERIDRRNESLIHIAGSNHLAHELHRAAKAIGLRVTGDPKATRLIVFPSISHPEVSDHDFCELETRPHLHVGVRHCNSTIGPLVTPGTSSCIRCAFLHRRDSDPTWPQQAIGWRNCAKQSTADPILTSLTAHFAIALVRQWLESPDPTEYSLTNTAWESQPPLPKFEPKFRPPHPLCGCQLSSPAARR